MGEAQHRSPTPFPHPVPTKLKLGDIFLLISCEKWGWGVLYLAKAFLGNAYYFLSPLSYIFFDEIQTKFTSETPR